MALLLVLAGRSRFRLRGARVIGEIPVDWTPQAAWTQIVARWIPGPRTRCRRVCHNEHGLPERITTGRQQLSRLMHLCRCSRPGGKITPAYNTLPAYNEGLLCAPPRK